MKKYTGKNERLNYVRQRKRVCRVSFCNQVAGNGAAYCPRHLYNYRKTGHPISQVQLATLKSYLKEFKNELGDKLDVPARAAEERHAITHLLMYPKLPEASARQKAMNRAIERIAGKFYGKEQEATERFIWSVLGVAYMGCATNEPYDILHECTSVARLWFPWGRYKPNRRYIERYVRAARERFIMDIVKLKPEMTRIANEDVNWVDVDYLAAEAELRESNSNLYEKDFY